MGIVDSVFGKRSTVERRKDVEEDVKWQSEMQRYEVKRSGTRPNQERTYQDPDTGRQHIEAEESKRNNSLVSPRQRKTRGLKEYRSNDTRYGREVRVEDKNGKRLGCDIFTVRHKKSLKRQSNRFGINSIFENNASKRKNRRKDGDLFSK